MEGLDLKYILGLIASKIWILLVLGIIFPTVVFAYSVFTWVPTYEAKVDMMVLSKISVDQSGSPYITSNDRKTAAELVNVYSIVVKSDTVLAKVCDKLDQSYTPTELRKMFTLKSVNQTEVFRITVANHNPQYAALIANTIADIAPNELLRIVKAGSVEIIDKATTPTESVPSDVVKNTIIAFFFGLALAIFIIIMIDYFDTKIRCEDDVKQITDYPVLGLIPSFGSENKKGTWKLYEK